MHVFKVCIIYRIYLSIISFLNIYLQKKCIIRRRKLHSLKSDIEGIMYFGSTDYLFLSFLVWPNLNVQWLSVVAVFIKSPKKKSTMPCQWLKLENMYTCTCIFVIDFKLLFVRAIWTLNSTVTMAVVHLNNGGSEACQTFCDIRTPRSRSSALIPKCRRSKYYIQLLWYMYDSICYEK